MAVTGSGGTSASGSVWQRLGAVVAWRVRDILPALRDTFAAERERWLLWLPVAFAGGIGIYFALPMEPVAGIGVALAIVAGVIALAGWWLARSGRAGQGVVVIALVVCAAAAGFATARGHAAAATAPVLERRIGPVMVEGVVAAVEPGLKGARLTLDDPVIARLAPARTPKRVRVRLRDDAAGVRLGDTVRLRAMLMPPPGPSAPGAYDFARDAWFQRLGGVGFVFGTASVIAPRVEEHGWRTDLGRAIGEARRALYERVRGSLPGTAGAVAGALMTGERGDIPPATMEALRKSGLAHLLAISGLHVGLVCGALFFGLRALLALFPTLALRYPIKKWAAVVALLGAGIYTLMTGATVPTQRAFLMVGVVLLAVMADRAAISMRLVALAAAVVLAIAPQSLLGPSFQMSFAAVVALIAAYEAARPRLARLRGDGGVARRAGLYVAGVMLTTAIAGFATAPFALYHFSRVAVFGLVANLGAVPLTALWVMPWATLAYVLAPLGLESLALAPMGWGVDAVVWIAEAVAAWPGAAAHLPEMPSAAFLAVVAGGLWLCLWRTRWRLAGLAPLSLGIVLAAMARPPDLLVAGDAQSFAVRDDDRLVFVGNPLGRFERETWLRRAGFDPESEESATRLAVPSARAGNLTCDSTACVYRAEGRTVSLIRNPVAAREDCARTDVVVALVPLGRFRCRGPARFVGRFDLWREGAHALWLDSGGAITIRTVAEARGVRPWAPRRLSAAERRRLISTEAAPGP
ncbi:MAG: ComEC/Rec2 family competence protein [Alphaproteobacteria bacterium]